MMFLPDEGAHITVRTTTGHTVKGYVSLGHTWASKDTLCLSDRATDDGEALFTYIRKDCIEAFSWDCRPG